MYFTEKRKTPTFRNCLYNLTFLNIIYFTYNDAIHPFIHLTNYTSSIINFKQKHKQINSCFWLLGLKLKKKYEQIEWHLNN